MERSQPGSRFCESFLCVLPIVERHVVVPPAPQRDLLVPVRNMTVMNRSWVRNLPLLV